MSEDNTGKLCSGIRIGSLSVECCPCYPLGFIKIELAIIIVLLSGFLFRYCKENNHDHCKSSSLTFSLAGAFI